MEKGKHDCYIELLDSDHSFKIVYVDSGDYDWLFKAGIIDSKQYVFDKLKVGQNISINVMDDDAFDDEPWIDDIKILNTSIKRKPIHRPYMKI